MMRHKRYRPVAEHAPRRGNRCRGKLHSSRGVTLVEAAFVTPVFFFLLLTVMEFGLLMANINAAAHSARAGTRALSASGNDLSADLYTLINVDRESTALNRGAINRIVVYKPSGFGEPPSSTCRSGVAVDGVCNVYDADDFVRARVQLKEETDALAEGRPVDPAKITFGCRSNSPDRHWCPVDRKVTYTGTGTEFVGIWIEIEHKWLTNLFGGSRVVEDRSIIRLEPRADES